MRESNPPGERRRNRVRPPPADIIKSESGMERPLSWRTSESVYEEAGPQLRLEPRGLRRHRGPRVRDRHDLGERRREPRERDGSPPRAHALLELARAPD